MATVIIIIKQQWEFIRLANNAQGAKGQIG